MPAPETDSILLHTFFPRLKLSERTLAQFSQAAVQARHNGYDFLPRSAEEVLHQLGSISAYFVLVLAGKYSPDGSHLAKEHNPLDDCYTLISQSDNPKLDLNDVVDYPVLMFRKNYGAASYPRVTFTEEEGLPEFAQGETLRSLLWVSALNFFHGFFLPHSREHIVHVGEVPISLGLYTVVVVSRLAAEDVPFDSSNSNAIGSNETPLLLSARSINHLAQEAEKVEGRLSPEVELLSYLLNIQVQQIVLSVLAVSQDLAVLDKQGNGLNQVLMDTYSPSKAESVIFRDQFFVPLVLLCIQVIHQLLQHVEVTSEIAELLSKLETLDRTFGAFATVESLDGRHTKFSFQVIFEKETGWTPQNVQAVVDWISLLFDPQHWRGEPPFYINLPEHFPDLPKFSILSDDELQTFAAHEFAGSLVFPSHLDPNQASKMWDDLAQTYDEPPPDADKEWQVAWNYKKWVFDKLLSLCNPVENGKHLELCCGPGNIITHIKEMQDTVEVHGLDISPEMIKRSQEKGMKAQVLDINQQPFPFEDACFETINISFGEMWLEPQAAFSETYRVLKEGGRFTFNVYNTQRLPIVLEIMREIGFKVEFIEEEYALGLEADIVGHGSQTEKKIVPIVSATK